jgi:hypothetical protein
MPRPLRHLQIFYPTYDSPEQNIQRIVGGSPKTLAAACDKDPRCEPAARAPSLGCRAALAPAPARPRLTRASRHPHAGLGFNSNGFLKLFIRSPDLWSSWTTDVCRGLYVKKPQALSSADGAAKAEAGASGTAQGWASRLRTRILGSKASSS